MAKEKKYDHTYYVSGFQVHQAKRVCEFFFGDYFVGIKLNQHEKTFEIKLKKTLMLNSKDTPVGEFLDLADFKSYWGSQWKLIYEVFEQV